MKESKGKARKDTGPKANASQPSAKGLAPLPVKAKT